MKLLCKIFGCKYVNVATFAQPMHKDWGPSALYIGFEYLKCKRCGAGKSKGGLFKKVESELFKSV